MNKLFRYLVLTLLLTTISCNDEYDVFEDSVEGYSKSDSKITVSELDKLTELIKPFDTERKFKKFFTNGSFDEQRLISFLEKNGGKVEKRIDTDKSKDYFVNVYIENSSSMIGYINGDTYFKTDVRELLTLLNHFYAKSGRKVNLFLINSETYPINKGDNLNFITNLTTKTFKVGKIFESDLNKVFKQVLDKTSKNTISIMISDCIYSVNGSASALSVQKSGIENAYLEKSNKGFKVSSEIIKLDSQFNGTYYDKINGHHSLSGEMRPYYMIAMGSDAVLSDFNNKIPFNDGKMNGFLNKLILSSNNYSNKVYYTLLKTTADVGRYSYLKEVSDKDSKKGLEDIDTRGRNFEFSVGVDYSSIPVESSYVLDSKNYKIVQGNYKIKNITEVNPSTKKNITAPAMAILGNNKITHYISFIATSKGQSDLECVLENKIPGWVYQTNTMDDTAKTIDKNKTFGFQYLVEGISEANKLINTKSQNLFEFNIKIK